VHTHGYNLREHPTNWKEWLSPALAYGDRTTGVKEKWQYLTVHPKVHAHIMLMQIDIKQGLLAFRERGNEGILKEPKQLLDKKAITPIQRMDMTTNKRKKVLSYLMFLKEKCDGTVKASGCADGRPQQEYTTEEKVSSPTVSLEAMVLSCPIDKKEGRYLVMTDIPGAFLHAGMEDEVHMLLEGTIVELIIKLVPSLYRKHIWYNQKGKPMLYVQLKSTIEKGTIWDATSSFTILEAIFQHITGVGFQDQLI